MYRIEALDTNFEQPAIRVVGVTTEKTKRKANLDSPAGFREFDNPHPVESIVEVFTLQFLKSATIHVVFGHDPAAMGNPYKNASRKGAKLAKAVGLNFAPLRLCVRQSIDQSHGP